MEGKKAFTLVELLVVIAIIALLMSILMPALARVRQQAKTVVCLSNLRQLANCFSVYANENDGRYPPGWIRDGVIDPNPKYYWMEALRSCYMDSGDIRLCPEATKIGSEHGQGEYNNNGRTDMAWGRFSGSWGWVIEGDYGSYGWNSFICSTPDGIDGQETSGAWGMTPSIYNWMIADVSGAHNIPLIGDHKWLDCWPHQSDEPPAYDGDKITSQMSRVCMNRHNGYVGWAFLDYSVRKVGLKELWTLKWSRQFKTDGLWTIAGGAEPSDWPEWMRDFKDF